jgi:hypothetical protein
MDIVDGAEEGAFAATKIVWKIVQQLLAPLRVPGSSAILNTMGSRCLFVTDLK